MTLTKPAIGGITRAYGPYTVNGITRFHYGTDRGFRNVPNGYSVFAMLDGQVTGVYELSDYGKIVLIDHGIDSRGNRVQSRYCHLSRQDVRYGGWVKSGEQIGLMGSTGSLTAQIHVHSELYLNGIRIDETKYTGSSAAGNEGEAINMATPQEVWGLNLDYNVGGPAAAGVRLLNMQGQVGTILTKVNALVPGVGSDDADTVDEAEMGSLLTALANVINAHTTEAKNEILAAIAAIPNAPAPAPSELTITLTGTAAPSA